MALRARFFEFSTGNPHPSASFPVYDTLRFERNMIDAERISVVISGDKLYIHCPWNRPNHTAVPNLVVLEWESGNCLFVSSTSSIPKFVPRLTIILASHYYYHYY